MVGSSVGTRVGAVVGASVAVAGTLVAVGGTRVGGTFVAVLVGAAVCVASGVSVGTAVSVGKSVDKGIGVCVAGEFVATIMTTRVGRGVIVSSALSWLETHATKFPIRSKKKSERSAFAWQRNKFDMD